MTKNSRRAGLHADGVGPSTSRGQSLDPPRQMEMGWERTTEMIWLKTQPNHPDKIKSGTGKRLVDQHETILIAVRGNIPPALPLWPSVMKASVGAHSEKPKLLMEMIDRDYGPELTRIEPGGYSSSIRRRPDLAF
jgi:N6-adenosine-specific RNA methylase IME4